MGIDPRQLAPWAQKQIAEKLLQQQREQQKRIATGAQRPHNDGGGAGKETDCHGPAGPRNDGDGDTSSVGEADSFPSRGSQRKYHNTPTERITEGGKTIKFDSQKEARRFDELMLMLKAGQIRDLRLQQNFTLQEGYTLPNGNRVKPLIYKADFTYERNGNALGSSKWEYVVEDVKSKATKTKVYAIKKKLMAEKFGIEVQEV